MDLDKHAYSLGAILGNLQSLESVLRFYLGKLPGATPFDSSIKDIFEVPIDTEVAENAFTNYDTLTTLIAKYNSSAHTRGLPPVDPTLVEIRDALAHGRVAAKNVGGTLRLLKFSKPQNGRVRVTFNTELSGEWFEEQRKRTRDALEAVCKSTGGEVVPGTSE